jgi:hypothetical protein
MPDPLAHLGLGQCVARVAAFPARNVERRIVRRPAALPVGIVPHRLPALHAGTVLRGRIRLPGHDVRDEPRIAVAAVTRHHDRLAHGVMLAERGFDLTQLDAMSAHLHLMIDPPQELDTPIVSIPGEIAGAIQPCTVGACARVRAGACERVRDELLVRQIRPPKIAARDARATDEQLPRRADGHESQPTIDEVNLRVGNRPADRHRFVGRGDGRGRRPHRGLGRAIHIQQPAANGGNDLADERLRQRLAAEHQHVDATQGVRARAVQQHCAQQRRRALQVRHLMTYDLRGDRIIRRRGFARRWR